MFIFGKYIYLNPVRTITSFDDIESAFFELEQWQKEQPQEKQSQKKSQQHKEHGFWVGYISYEAKDTFHSQKPKSSPSSMLTPMLSSTPPMPIFEFTLFKERKRFTPQFLHSSQSLPPLPHFYPNLIAPLDYERYKRDFAYIKQQLARGNSYQVNYTQELAFSTHCDGLEIFTNLLYTQDTPYKAYLKTKFVEIISFSPELFFKLNHDTITLQPMKGTIKRGKTPAKDAHYKTTLQNDEKNKSENMMIVDLLRNDISQIALPHTLQIQNLCTIHTYPTLHQMISTLKAKLPQCRLYDIFKALFPCGSITGAPKKSTMEIIQSLEKRERGVYCGSIGVISKDEAIFSVPIRTLVRRYNEAFYRYGVGSGIVWDSRAKQEFQELKLKTHFLFTSNHNMPPSTQTQKKQAKSQNLKLQCTTLQKPRFQDFKLQDFKLQKFKLIETMLFQNGRVFLLYKHLNRLAKSARALDFETKHIAPLLHSLTMPTLPKIRNFLDFMPLSLKELWQNLPIDFMRQHNLKASQQAQILRINLDKKGRIYTQILPLHTSTAKQQIRLSTHTLNPHNDLLYHKTTMRDHFYTDNTSCGHLLFDEYVFDTIFANTNGEICEGSRSNIIITNNTQLFTPSAQSGLLCGTFRELLLECNIIKEKIITIDELHSAEQIFCINSVRGITPVFLHSQPTSESMQKSMPESTLDSTLESIRESTHKPHKNPQNLHQNPKKKRDETPTNR